MKLSPYFMAWLCLILLLSSCKKDEVLPTHSGSGKTNIKFDAVFNASDFALNKDFTQGNRIYNFNKFRYWVSNLVLIKTNGEEFKIPASYFLLEETSAVAVQDGAFTYPATKREEIALSNIPAGEYKNITFSVGVDSKYNDNLSLQSGELSQLNGMTNVSWMWMTSYIFTSIGGKITDGTVTKNLKVETGLNANYRTVSLSFPTNVVIDSGTNNELVINADIAKALEGIDVMTTPSIGAAQATAMSALASNYSTRVFSIKSAK